MYNRYLGNSGKPERVEERKAPPRPAPPAKAAGRAPVPERPAPLFPAKLGQSLSELETEDILLILILYLMYRESGDKELLLIMGAMYLL